MDPEAQEGPMRVGDFARLVGLTPKALRHYDRVGLLRPLDVDPATGYRLYGRSQLPAARLIGRLRRLDLPLAEVRALVELAPDRGPSWPRSSSTGSGSKHNSSGPSGSCTRWIT